ncbi:MAG: SpoIIE family protein phosphatase [Chloroflexi bacterium]|nr:SpoIIE family protein phosphatase [Chloroflexota bacterium]
MTPDTRVSRLTRLRQQYLRLTHPHPSITDPEHSRTARVLASLALALAGILGVAAVISLITSIAFPDPAISLGPVGTALIAATAFSAWLGYRFSLTQRYTIGAWITLIAIIAFLTGLILIYRGISVSLTSAYVVAVLIAALLLDVRSTVQAAFIGLALMALMAIVQGIQPVTFGFVWGSGLAVTLLILLVSVLREQDLRQLKRLRELESNEGERLRRELDLARKVQVSMLPKELPVVHGLDVAAFSQPAYEASGDFYDVFYIDRSQGEQIAVVVCDVAGKGMPSALVMSATRAALRAEAERNPSPAEVLRKVNEVIVATIPSGLFVTLFYGVYDPQARTLCYASAGHPHPFWWHDARTTELENFGMPLGLVLDCEYTTCEIQLAAGDALFIYTDGLVEALNPRREMFGFEMTQKTVEQHARQHVSASTLVSATLNDMQTFVEGERQQDDVTIVVLQVTDAAAS